jgi:uncharacterized protein (TIGR00369 family)
MLQESAFLENHQSGMGKLLGITFPSTSHRRVVAQIEIDPRHLAVDGAVHGSVVTALADCASTYGAMLNLPPGSGTTTVESKTSFLTAGEGRLLRAEASPLHLGSTVSVWRAAVFRDEQQIADVTQTQMTVDEKGGDVSEPRGRSEEPRIRGALSDNFSKAIVDERWRQILEGASKVIALKGFAKATIREIAAAAEMPVPTMYQYLERKEDILHSIYKFFMTDIVTTLERWRSNDMPPRDRLVGAIRTMIDVFDKNHRFIKLMFQETRALTPEARRQVYELDAQYIAILRELLTETMRSGDLRIRNVELAANFVYFLCTIWPLRFWSIGKFGEEAVTSEILDFVLNGLGAAEHPQTHTL